jgi:hypothetical protein
MPSCEEPSAALTLHVPKNPRWVATSTPLLGRPRMTATRNLAVEQIAADGDATMCDVCGHALTAHDRIAERYCQATMHNALSRTCICPMPDSPATGTSG